MPTNTKNIKIHSKQKTNYLTKRILIQAANKGFSNAAKQTMKVLGYNVIVQGDWVVKKYQDGKIEKISELEKSKTKTKFNLD
jgi:hypothetical protein